MICRGDASDALRGGSHRDSGPLARVSQVPMGETDVLAAECKHIVDDRRPAATRFPEYADAEPLSVLGLFAGDVR